MVAPRSASRHAAAGSLERLVHRRADATRHLIAELSGPAGLLHQPVDRIDAPRVRIDGRWVLNFASSNYLGLDALTGPSDDACRTESLAMPRVLATEAPAARLERELAALVHREACLLFPSTLHAAMDVVGLLAGRAGRVIVDEHAYPISLTAARAAASRGGRVSRFRHNDPESLARLLAAPARGRDTVVICDGVYPVTGLPASLGEIGAIASAAGATVYVDDAHGLGIFGADPTPEMPYGQGGGGAFLHTGALPGNIAYVASLSKAFGVPVAFVAGPASFVEYLRETADSVIHSSPPAAAVVHDALLRLERHAIYGDRLRQRLLALVRYFRRRACGLGLPVTTRTAFPVQSIGFSRPADAIAAGRWLRRSGVWPVLALDPGGHQCGAALRFVITAAHHPDDIDAALDTLAAVRQPRSGLW